MKKLSIKKLFLAIFGGFFMLLSILSFVPTRNVLAADQTQAQTQTTTQAQTQQTETQKTEEPKDGKKEEGTNFCDTELGKISWRLCPETEKVSNAADWIYDKIEEILIINPVAAKDGEPVYEIWKYCRDITNIVFVIFLLIITFSQITGLGINNYGIKKALPKLIIGAILVNLSFIICSIAVDMSNIIGMNLRGLFDGIENTIAGGTDVSKLTASYSEYYSAITSGTGLTIAGIVVAIESGTIWMLIPTVLAALASVVIGLITVAMRQAVVVLLVMIAPLAIVACILPNTEDLYKRWKKTFTKMLVFFPIMSLLIGASNLAGWAMIRGAQDGFMILLGKAVQFFPLFLSFKMMKMSDTILGTVSGKLTALTRPLIASNTAWASSHRALTKSRMLSNPNPYTPYARLSQFLTNRRLAREADTAENENTIKLQGAAYRARRHYKGNGLSRTGKEDYAQQAYDMALNKEILNDKNNFNEGFSARFKKGDKEYDEMLKLDTMNVNAADDLYAENVRTAAIDYHNAEGRHKRFEDAMNAHADIIDRYRLGHEEHFGNTPEEQARREAALARYQRIGSMFTDNNLDKNFADTAYIASDAAAAFNAQAQVRQGKFQKWFDMTVPTQDVVNRLEKFTSSADAASNIDAIIAGCRTLNQRGDGKLLREAIESLTSDMKIEVGTNASQALAGFLMFEVKDNDPFLRRFGKYINLETARYYNSNNINNVNDGFDNPNGPKRRHRRGIDLTEYVRGGYEYNDVDEHGQPTVKFDKAKRGMTQLLMGTSFKGVEREAYLNILEGVTQAFKRPDGTVNYDEASKVSKNVLNSIMPNVVGDYSNYSSGSEQVNSFATFMTGMKVKEYRPDDNGVLKPIYDWDEQALAMMDSPDKSKNTAFNRVRSFMDALVVNQATRMKTDVLYPVKEVFKRQAEQDLTDPADEAAAQRIAQWRAEEEILHVKTNENGQPVVSDADRYSHWLFRDSLKNTIRGSIAQNITSGFQSDTKDNFLEAMGYKDDYENNELISQDIARFAPKRKRTDSDNPHPAANVDEPTEPTDILTGAERAQWVQSMREAFHDFNPALTPGSINAVLNHALNTMDNAELGLSSAQKQQIRELQQTQSSNTSTEEIISAIESIING